VTELLNEFAELIKSPSFSFVRFDHIASHMSISGKTSFGAGASCGFPMRRLKVGGVTKITGRFGQDEACDFPPDRIVDSRG
jgi:hypothetical protein